MAGRNDDEGLITRIVEQLERGGPLNDPRDPRASSPTDDDDLIIADAVAAIKCMGVDPDLKAVIESEYERAKHDGRLEERQRKQAQSGNAWAPAQIRAEDRSSPLKLYVRAETRRCISRVRMPEEPPRGKLGPPTAADIKRAIKAMERIAWTDAMREQIEWAKSIQVFPPDKRADMAKHGCAEESWFLMEYFSAQPPTGTEGGPFTLIAEFLFEGLTGSEDNSMKRACAAVLDRRRRHSWRWDILGRAR